MFSPLIGPAWLYQRLCESCPCQDFAVFSNGRKNTCFKQYLECCTQGLKLLFYAQLVFASFPVLFSESWYSLCFASGFHCWTASSASCQWLFSWVNIVLGFHSYLQAPWHRYQFSCGSFVCLCWELLDLLVTYLPALPVLLLGPYHIFTSL